MKHATQPNSNNERPQRMLPLLLVTTLSLIAPLPEASAMGKSKREVQLETEIAELKTFKFGLQTQRDTIQKRLDIVNKTFRNAGLVTWKISRCDGTLGDSLEQSQVQGRVSWSEKCMADRLMRIDGILSGLGNDGGATPEGMELRFENAYWNHMGKLMHEARANSALKFTYPSWAHLPFSAANLEVYNRSETEGNHLNFSDLRIEKAPISADAACMDLDSAAYKTYRVAAICEGGCYTPQTQVEYSAGELNFHQAQNLASLKLRTLDTSATMNGVRLNQTPLDHFTLSPVPQIETILTIKTERGRELELTPLHPVLRADGTLVRARDLKSGDLLLSSGGEIDPVSEIFGRSEVTQVYNVQPASSLPADNIVVAQGLLMGSSFLQNHEANDLNRIIFRLNIPTEILQ